MTVTLLVPHAIIFLYDISHKDVCIPEYIDGSLTSANSSCVSVGTQADVDGEVTLNIVNFLSDEDKKNLQKIFDGNIEAPGRKVSVSTSEDEGVLEINVFSNIAHLTVWVDDLNFPSIVSIEAR